MAIVYRLSKLSLGRINSFPFLDEDERKIQQWFWTFLRASGHVVDLIVSHMSEEGENNVAESMFIAYIDEYRSAPHQWNIATFAWIAQWLSLLLEKQHHRGSPPFYVYIKKSEGQNFPSKVPRMFEGENWLSGFGGRLLIPPNVQNLSAEQKAELWNTLLIDKDIYGDRAIDHSVRESVFEGVLKFIPMDVTDHVDLCGGKGDFILWLKEHRPEISSVLIDIADQAVDHAQKLGIDARVGNAQQPLKIDHQVDVISIIFAMQWLSPEAYIHVLYALKPGGHLIANIYPSDLQIIEVLFRETLEKAGFDDIELHTVETQNGEVQHIVRAKKPETPIS